MGRNIIICSDGTGNTFDESISNVTRLIELLDLDNHQTQVVVYGQGVGTNAERLQAIENFRLKISDQSALEIMSAPKDFCIDIKGVITRISGLLIGTGFEHNLKGLILGFEDAVKFAFCFHVSHPQSYRRKQMLSNH